MLLGSVDNRAELIHSSALEPRDVVCLGGKPQLGGKILGTHVGTAQEAFCARKSVDVKDPRLHSVDDAVHVLRVDGTIAIVALVVKAKLTVKADIGVKAALDARRQLKRAAARSKNRPDTVCLKLRQSLLGGFEHLVRGIKQRSIDIEKGSFDHGTRLSWF